MALDQPSTKKVLLGAMGIVFAAGFCLYLVAGWANVKWEENGKRVEANRKFEDLVSSLPLGIDLEEVEKNYFGRQADVISEVDGVLKGPNRLLTDEATEGLETKPYKLHRWNEGDCSAVVVFNEEGIVEGKWVWGGVYGNRGSYKKSSRETRYAKRQKASELKKSKNRRHRKGWFGKFFSRGRS